MTFTSGSTGGAYKIKLSASQLPPHNHNGQGGPLMIAGGTGRNQIGTGSNASYGNTNNGNGLSNDPIDIRNPYSVVNFWIRVA